jgi:hypothetical protein
VFANVSLSGIAAVTDDADEILLARFWSRRFSLPTDF